mmetsp:Transcript_15394/g.31124  ORF Transcript_15394/g.31124 Transcript_15394/m.31124 type:complete len:259 (-) Transcript_15394:108-884(-)
MKVAVFSITSALFAVSATAFSPIHSAASFATRSSVPPAVSSTGLLDGADTAAIESVTNDGAAAAASAATSASTPLPDIVQATPANIARVTEELDLENIAPLPPPAAPALDLDVVALVAGQETYGLAIVALGEALWSFLQAPSADHALKTFGPAGVAAVILVAVSGPMVTSGDASSVTLGLEIATATSMLLGLSYLARLLAPYSPSPKEIAFLGLLISLAGFFSFSQNLVVDGFIALPSLPSIPLPQLPSFDFSFFNFD